MKIKIERVAVLIMFCIIICKADCQVANPWMEHKSLYASSAAEGYNYDLSKVKTYRIDQDSVAIFAITKKDDGDFYLSVIKLYQAQADLMKDTIQSVIIPYDTIFDFVILDNKIIYSAANSNNLNGILGMINISDLLNITTSTINQKTLPLQSCRLHKIQAFKENNKSYVIGIGLHDFDECYFKIPLDISMMQPNTMYYKAFSGLKDICITDDYVVLAKYDDAGIHIYYNTLQSINSFNDLFYDFSSDNMHLEGQANPNNILIGHTTGNEIFVIRNANKQINDVYSYYDIIGTIDLVNGSNIQPLTNIKLINHPKKDIVLVDAVFEDTTQSLTYIEQGTKVAYNNEMYRSVITEVPLYDNTLQNVKYVTESNNMVFFGSIDKYRDRRVVAIGVTNSGNGKLAYYTKLHNDAGCLFNSNLNTTHIPPKNPTYSNINVQALPPKSLFVFKS